MDKIYELQEFIVNTVSPDDMESVFKYYNEMIYIRNQYIQDVKQMRAIIASTNEAICEKLDAFEDELNSIQKPVLTKSDIMMLTRDDSACKSMHNVAPGIDLPMLTVPNESFIPNSYLYFDKSTGKAGIKILGHTIMGHIGHIKNHKKKHIKCKQNKQQDNQEQKCLNINKCQYGHDEMIPTWQQSEFLYTKDPYNKNNKLMRHIGDRDRLLHDVWVVSPDEQKKRKEQLAHDILVQLCICKFH